MRKTIMFIIMAIASVIAYSQSSEEEISLNSPEIFFTNTIYDFDTITKGSNGNCVFEFTNNGSKPLLVSSVFSSCGCTIPTWSKEPVFHDTKSTINVHYNTDITGPFKKAIIVKSNSETNSKVVLWIKGVVVENKG